MERIRLELELCLYYGETLVTKQEQSKPVNKQN